MLLYKSENKVTACSKSKNYTLFVFGGLHTKTDKKHSFLPIMELKIHQIILVLAFVQINSSFEQAQLIFT